MASNWWSRPSCRGRPERDIDVSVDNGVLTIAAERRESNREKSDKGFHSEFRYGSFVRQVRLPAGTSPEVVSATSGRCPGDPDAEAIGRGSLASYPDPTRLTAKLTGQTSGTSVPPTELWASSMWEGLWSRS